jgi:hypothetical protein
LSVCQVALCTVTACVDIFCPSYFNRVSWSKNMKPVFLEDLKGMRISYTSCTVLGLQPYTVDRRLATERWCIPLFSTFDFCTLYFFLVFFFYKILYRPDSRVSAELVSRFGSTWLIAVITSHSSERGNP